MTREHPVIKIMVPGMGSLENRTPVAPGVGSSDMHNKGSKSHASKAKRNFRINGESRGASPTLASSTKYVRSGGPERRAARIARNLARQQRLSERGAQRRMGQVSRRLDRRILKAAEHLIDALD